MRTPIVEIRDVLGQYPTKVALTEDKGVIQAFLPDRSHPSLGDRICPRRSEGRTNLISNLSSSRIGLRPPFAGALDFQRQ
jgi:hypothetical protein